MSNTKVVQRMTLFGIILVFSAIALPSILVLSGRSLSYDIGFISGIMFVTGIMIL